MKFIKSAWLAGSVALMAGAIGFAKDPPPFTILSLSVERPAQHRTLPEFSLVERSGKRVTLSNLRGKVWIADFIYTSCTDTCPLQSADMAGLQDQWPNEKDLKLVSFSVDPDRDTPPVLSRYARRFKADPKRWLFLTGDRSQIVHLIEDGFHLAVTPASGTHKGSAVIVHSPRFVLVDRQGQIHGYYDDRDLKSMQRLKEDVAKLLRG